jgi:hypothetical protein
LEWLAVHAYRFSAFVGIALVDDTALVNYRFVGVERRHRAEYEGTAEMRRFWSGQRLIGAGVVALALTGTMLGVAVSPAGATSGTSDAGYTVKLKGTASRQLTSTVKLPKLTCKKSDTSGDLLSTAISGTLDGAYDAAGVIVTMSCTGTTPTYSIFGVVDDSHTTSSVSASAGDVISVAVIASPTFETASFSDTTSGQGTYVDGTGFDPTQAGWDVQGGSGAGHFPKFGATTFSDLTIGNKALAKFAATSFNQLDGEGSTEISVGPLSANGKSFVATYVANT